MIQQRYNFRKENVMSKLKLTQKIVDGLKGTEKLECYFDENLTGFGVYTKGKTKTYFVQARANGKLIKSTIGKTNILKLEDARKEAKDKLTQMSKGINPNEEKRKEALKGMTLSEATDKFFETRNLKAQTEHLYRTMIRLYMSDWENKPIGSITKEMIAQRHTAVASGKRGRKVNIITPRTQEEIDADLKSAPNKKPKLVERVEVETPKPRNASANNLMRTFRSIYNFARAISNDAIPENPVGRLSETRQWFRVERRRTLIKPHELKPWQDEVQCLENAAARDFMLLVLFTGARREEAVPLKWSDIDFKDKTVIFRETKNKKPHTLPLSDYLFKLLEDRKKNYYENEFVFPGPGKKGYMYPPVKPMRQVIDKTGIAFCFHDLRRTFITVAESLDIPYAALKRLLNHSMGTDVTDGYLAISTDRLRGPMEKISQKLLELMIGTNQDTKNVVA
jgi:integrase